MKPAPVASLESRPRPDLPRYTIEQLFATRVVGDADWSPDGARVVFVSNISGRNNLWIVPAGGGWPAQLTVSEERQASPAWSPDGRSIAFESDHEADEQWDVFLVDVRSGAVENLTRTPEVSEENPTWSPDGRFLAWTTKPRAAPNYELALYEVAARRGRPLTRETPPHLSYAPVAFVPGGRFLLANRTAASDKDGDALLVDLETGALRILTGHAGEQTWSAADVSPDGRWVALTSNARNGFDNVALLDLEAALGAPESAPPPVTWVTAERWEMSAASFSPDGATLVYEANVDGNGELFRYDLAARRRARIKTGPGYASFAGAASAFTRDGARLLYRRSAADTPGDLFVHDVRRKRATQITQGFVAGVDPADMVEPYLVHYPSRGQKRISAYLYVPANLRRDGTHPAVVWVHGGPMAQSGNEFNRVIQYLVNGGYVVLAPNYRGSTGYGKAFVDANRFDMGGGDLLDVVAGAYWLAQTGFVDAARIAIAGGSYGGYLTMMGLTKAPEVWAAGAALFPFVNWFTELEHEDPLLQQYDLANMGDPADPEAAARFRDRSPIFFVDRIRAPLLLIAGRNDPRCPPEESQQVYEALRGSGRTCEFLLYEDEGHGFARRENLFDAYRKLAAFLDGALKDAATAASARV